MRVKAMKGGEMKESGNGRGILFKEAGKTQKGLKRMAVGLVVVGLCLTLLLGSVIPSRPTLANEKTVTIGLHLAVTGPIATTGVRWADGAFARVDYMNNELGGISGIKINAPWYETKGEVPRGIIAHKRLMEAGEVVELTLVGSQAEVLAPMMQRDEVPLLWEGGITQQMITKPIRWVWALGPQMEVWVPFFAEWINESWQKEHPPRIGMLFYDETAGWSMYEGAKYFAEEAGYEFVGHEVTPLFGVIDTSTEWLRLAGKKPDWIYVCAYFSTIVTMIKDAARLGIMEKGIGLCAAACALDEAIIKVTGKAADGWYSLGIVPSNAEYVEYGGMQNPALGTIYRALEQYRDVQAEDVAIWSIVGWLQVEVATEAVRIAIEKVGYENLTGRAVRDAFARLDHDTGVIPREIMTEDKPWYLTHLKMYRIEECKVVPVSQYRPTTYYYPLQLD